MRVDRAAGIGLAQIWRRRRLRAVVVLVCAWSLLAVWSETIGGQSFPDYTANPLFDLSLPKLLSGDVARNAGMVLGLRGWSSLAPLLGAGLAAAIVWLRLEGGGTESLRTGAEVADHVTAGQARLVSR